MSKTRPPWRRFGLPLLVGILFAAGMVYFINKSTSELPVYTVAAERMLAGEEIYRTDDLKPFTYPPFFALPFVPLVLLPDVLQRPAWYCITIAALVLIVVALRRCLEPMREPADGIKPPGAWLFWLIVAALAGRHLSAVIENQSHDLLVFLAVMGAVYFSVHARDGASGLLAGAGAACKATPGLFLPVYALQRRFRAVLLMAAAGAALTFLPDLLLPRSAGSSWAVAWFQTFVQGMTPGETAQVEGTWNAWNKLNQNLTGTIYRLTTEVERMGDYMFDVSICNASPTARSVISAGAQGLVFLFLLFATRPGRTRGMTGGERGIMRLGEGGAIVCAMVLLSPMSSKSHFCVLLLPIAFCTADYLYRKRDPVVAVLLGLVFVSGTLTAKQILGKTLGDQLLARGTITLCAIFLFLATAHVLHHRSKARVETEAP